MRERGRCRDAPGGEGGTQAGRHHHHPCPARLLLPAPAGQCPFLPHRREKVHQEGTGSVHSLRGKQEWGRGLAADSTCRAPSRRGRQVPHEAKTLPPALPSQGAAPSPNRCMIHLDRGLSLGLSGGWSLPGKSAPTSAASRCTWEITGRQRGGGEREEDKGHSHSKACLRPHGGRPSSNHSQQKPKGPGGASPQGWRGDCRAGSAREASSVGHSNRPLSLRGGHLRRLAAESL